jgi:uncharacterized protein
MNEQVNALNWFEIPASNLARAKQFYETIFGIEMGEMEMMGTKMALFPAEAMSGKVSGAVVQGEMYQPSQDGAKIYLNGNPDLNNVLSKIVAAGGSIQMPKTHISPEIGHMAFFTDS